jgi:hypothetical protein
VAAPHATTKQTKEKDVMTMKANMSKLATFAAATVLLVGFAAGASGQTLKAPTGPQAGDCKRGIEAAFGASPVHAQAMWANAVSVKYGENWANWPAAQGAAVNQVGQQPLPFLAVGKPCYIPAAG